MALLEDFGNAEDNDLGVWVEFAKDKDTGDEVKLRIRAMSDDIERKIRSSHSKGGRDLVMNVDKREMKLDLERSRKISRDKANWCWLDAENFSVLPKDKEAVTTWSSLLGGDVVVDTNVPLKLDGKLSKNVKAHILDKFTAIADFIVKEADKLKGEISEEDKDLEGN